MARRGGVEVSDRPEAGTRSGRSRRLTPEEASLWALVVQSVTPLPLRRRRAGSAATAAEHASTPLSPVPISPAKAPMAKAPKGRVPEPLPPPPPPPASARPLDRHGLDANWDRRLAKGAIAPDFTLDLHGSSLDAAYLRLELGLTLAMAQGARVVLVITGRARPYGDPADRGNMRGAIRAKLLDWLAHGRHAGRIAAVRGAHPRHGGGGAVYVVLKRLG